MYKNQKVTAILLAGGSGTRFGVNGNKVYVNIGGEPILQYSLEVLAGHPAVDQCIFVVKDGEQEIARRLVENAAASCVNAEKAQSNEDTGNTELSENRTGWVTKIDFAIGGASRQESVYHGLQKTTGDIVLIHDSARPMIRPEYVDRCLEAMDRVPGASIGVKSKDTIKLTDDQGIVTMTTVRANTWVVQTPQCFRTAVLKQAHEKYKDAPGITDDCSILELAGEPVQMLEGDYTNIKVTTPEDRDLAETFLQLIAGE